MEHWAKKIRINRPKAFSKHVWTILETIKGIFWILIFFWFFRNFSKARPSMEHRAKNCWVKLPQNMFKTRLHTFGNVLGFFGIFKNFWFFWNFSKTRPSMEHWAGIFFRKERPKTRLDTWERFGQCENFEIFLIFFLNFFYVSTSNFKSGKPNSNFLSSKNWPHLFKSRKSEKPCMEHRANKNRKNRAKACSKRVWTLLTTTLDTFGILKIFWFFLQFFENPTLHGTRGNFFSKKNPQNMFKTSLDNFGNNSGHFCKFEFSLIFSKTFDDSMEHWSKKRFQKNCPKTRLDTWKRFWTFSELWNFFDFFFNFFWVSTSKFKSRKLDSKFSSPENWIHIFEFGNLNSQF